MTDLRAALESVETRLAAAERVWKEARRAVKEPRTAGGPIGAPLALYHRDVQTRRRQPDVSEERRLTRDLFEQLKQDGVSLVPIDAHAPARGFQIEDRRSAFAVEAAHAKVLEARRDRDRFVAEHADELRADEERQKMEAVRGALAGDDLDALRAALDAEEQAHG